MKTFKILAGAVIALGLTGAAPEASAAFTYFDADTVGYVLSLGKAGTQTVAPNTTLVDGSPVPTTGSDSGADGIWRLRNSNDFGNRVFNGAVDSSTTKPTFDNGGVLTLQGDILEARGQNGGPNTENVPTLKTTVSVPLADQGIEKGVLVFFWSDTSSWSVAASLTNSNDVLVGTVATPSQPIFRAGNPQGAISYGTTLNEGDTEYLFNVYDASSNGGTLNGVTANPLFANDNSLLTTTDGANSGGPAGNRQLWAAFLGNVTLGSELTVFVGEGVSFTADQLTGNGGANYRTWYDGIGYTDPIQLAPLADLVTVPEPTSAILAILGVLGVTSRRRG